MIQILKAKKDFLIKLFKTKSLRRNVLFLSLSGVLLTFLIMIVTAPMFLYFIQSVITERGNQWSEHVADLTEKLYHGQTRMHLREKVAIHSDLINKNLVDIAEDAKNISAGMEEILKNKAQYLPRYLPDPRQEQVPLGKAYVLFNKRTLGKLPLDVMEELYQVSNVEDFMVAVTAEEYFDKFSDVTVVSAKDYVISMDYEPNATFVTMTEEYMDNLDYQMQSSWYKAVRETGKIFFTTPHYNEGNYFLHCGAPYYDADGNFAGGIGIGTEVNYLYNAVVDFDTDDPTIGIIVNQDGKIIMSSEKEGLFSVGDKDMRLNEDENLSAVFKKMTAMDHDVVSLTFSDTKYYVAFAPIKVANWSFGTIIENKTANAASNLAKERILEQMDDFKNSIGRFFFILMIFSSTMIVVMLAFLLWLGIRESDKFLKPIQNLIGGVQEISKGNFDRRLEVTTEDEIGTLANAVNTMAGELKTYMTDLTKVTAEKERISTELNVATNNQLSALPHDFLTERSEFEIFATMKAAKAVGGDFYDFYLVDEKHLIMTIADVSGKGVPAALFMMKGKTILKNLATMMKSPDDLASVMTLANQQLCQDNDEMMFITVFLAMLDLETGKLIYVNGGHNPPMLYRDSEKKFHYMDVEQNCVLGLMDEMDFVQQETQMKRGDIIYLYTDGVTEAMNSAKEQYSEARLENCLNAIDHQSNLSTLLEGVSKSVAEHVQDAEQSDDITMLAVRFMG